MKPSRVWSAVLVAAVATVVAVGGVLTIGGQRASSATQISWGGSPGPFSVGRIISDVRYNVEDEHWYVSLIVLGPTVGRSPAIAGDQLVLVATELFMWGPATGWWAVDSRLNQLVLSSGTLTSWPSSFHSLMPGYYRVRHTIVWGLNHVQVDYNHPTDYTCIGDSPVRALCTAFSQGYIYVHPLQ